MRWNVWGATGVGTIATSARRQARILKAREKEKAESKDMVKVGERGQVQKEKDGGRAEAEKPNVEKEHMVWDPM